MRTFDVEVRREAEAVRRWLRVSATSKDAAALQVLSRGEFPLRVRRARHTFGLARISLRLRDKPHLRLGQWAAFMDHLAELLQAGIDLEGALDLLSTRPVQGRASETNRMAGRLLGRLREGASLSGALAQEVALPPDVCGVVRGAERAGRLGRGVESLARSLQRRAEARQRVVAALSYPAAVCAMALGTIVFVLTLVIPQFVPMLGQDEARLPAVTRLVLWLSRCVTEGADGLLAVAMTAAAALGLLASRASSRAMLQASVERLPAIRRFAQLDLGQAIRVFGRLLEAGAQASEAFALASQASAFESNRAGFAHAARLVREGAGMSEVFARLPHLADVAATLMSVGVRTGDAAHAALRSADLIESRAWRAIDRMLGLIYPVAVVVLGLVIAMLIAGVMLGILSMHHLALQ